MARKHLVKLTTEERLFVDHLKSISGIDTETIKELFISLLVSIGINLYSGKNEFHIPYIGKIVIDYETEPDNKQLLLKEQFKIQASPSLRDILVKIAQGKEIPLEEYFKYELQTLLNDILNIEDKNIPQTYKNGAA